MTQASFNDLIRVNLTLHGWPLHQIGCLAAFHGKSSEVTPYYCFAEAPMRPYGRLAVTGMIGIVHRGFGGSGSRDASANKLFD